MPRTQTHSPQSPRRRPSLLVAIAATILLLTVGAATAMATSTIEGVWSFNGGQIAIQPEGNGKFEGIVVSPTTFATCTHPDGQKIWKEISQQSDGSYWGFHQWYYEDSSCTENPNLGHTAWRVIEETGGGHYLRVCLSEPGKPQPTIPPSSSGTGSYGCVSSALIAPLPTTTGTSGTTGSTGTTTGSTGTGSSGTAAYKESLSLPSARQCLSRRLFAIHLQDPKYDPFKTVIITIKGKKIPTVRKGKYIVATVNLKGLPKGKFTLKITATTVLGHHLSASRAYHTCIKKIVSKSGKKK
jgi:hypothetical protein